MKLTWIQLALGLFQADQAIKQEIETNPYFGQEHELCSGRVRLKKLHNYGMAGGSFAGHTKEIIRISGLAALAGAAMLLKHSGKDGRAVSALGYSLLTGGALSNLYDRCRRGHVVDYISFRSPVRRLNSLVFNLADFFILAGAVLICFGQTDQARE